MKHVLRCCSRRNLSGVEGDDLTSLGNVQGHEEATPDTKAVWAVDSIAEHGGNGGVHSSSIPF